MKRFRGTQGHGRLPTGQSRLQHRRSDDQPYGDARHGVGYGYGLEGMGVKEAQIQLSNAGYTKARNIKINGRQFDLWANPRARDACVGFTSISGRVTEARTFNNTDCGVVTGGGRLDANQLHGMRVDDAKWNLQQYGYKHERNAAGYLKPAKQKSFS